MEDYSSAIAVLEVALANVVNNEPIWRAEGNEAEADLCAVNAVKFRSAIEKLSG